jgi:cytochrome bd-type quinol oxidase subunit 2
MKLLALVINATPIVAPSGIPTGGTGMLEKIIQVGINVLFLAAIVLSVIFFILGGIDWIRSEGEKQKIESARKKLTYAIIGLVVVFLSFLITRFVGSMLGAPGLV